MCDYSLQGVASRPAAVGDKLITRNFGTGTRGFGASEDRRCSKIEVGEAESGAEEGGVGRVRPPIVGTQQDGMS